MMMGARALIAPCFAGPSNATDEIHPVGTNTYQKVTGNDSGDDQQHWNSVFNTRAYVYGREPAAFLQDHVSLLSVGSALDIATGEGRNAVYLAKKGFQVDAVDFSAVALRKAKRLAHENHVFIHTINADLTHYTIPTEKYEVIVDIDYLQLSLIPQIKRGLKKGGIVVFENGELKPGELRDLFRDFKILVYRESPSRKGSRESLIARKP